MKPSYNEDYAATVNLSRYDSIQLSQPVGWREGSPSQEECDSLSKYIKELGDVIQVELKSVQDMQEIKKAAKAAL